MGKKKDTVRKCKGSRIVSSNSVNPIQKFNVNPIQKVKEIYANNKIVRFAASYIFYIGLFTLTYITFKDNLSFLSTLTASLLSAVLGIFGIESTVYESVVHLSTISLQVIDECTGMYEILVYAGCVLAYPTSSGNKLTGIAFGIPAMLSINMVRLVFLSFIGLWYPSLFNYAHYYLWQVTFIVLILVVMLVWIEKVVKK